MLERYIANLGIAFDSVLSNKLRSLLTGLGIIFGVAAVIAMLAIGAGAQKEILNQIKLVGVNNIVITPVVEQEEEDLSENEGGGQVAKNAEANYSRGLHLLDAASIEDVVPNLSKISPEIIVETSIIKNGKRRTSKLVGVENAYFDIFGWKLDKGNFFNQTQLNRGESVCIIGNDVKGKFFSKEDPLGKRIKVGNHWLTIIGVLQRRQVTQKTKDIGNLGIRNYNMDVYTPLKSVLIRYKNRALVTDAMIQFAQRMRSEDNKKTNYHQLDKIVVQVDKTETLEATRNVLARMLERRHFKNVDFEITIPELLLKQQQKTRSIFNFVLGAIAGISLLVGGIGIMNIMLASVMERIKEIGLRLAIGARKKDIISQFLFEAVMISISGGFVGVILGVVLAHLVSNMADIPTEVSAFSILLSFGVAATVGLIFGITPAKRAAEQDPISSLRHE